MSAVNDFRTFLVGIHVFVFLLALAGAGICIMSYESCLLVSVITQASCVGLGSAPAFKVVPKR
jgi:hypothetical protein